MKKEMEARIKRIVGIGMSYGQLLEKIASLNEDDQQLDATIAVVYGEFTFPDSQEIKGMIKQYGGNMHDFMLYTTIRKYYQETRFHTKHSSQLTSTTNDLQPTA